METSDKSEQEYVDAAVQCFREALRARLQAHAAAGNDFRRVLGAPDDLGTRAAYATVPEPSP